MVDVLDMVIACVVHAADIQDEDGCEAVLDQAKERFPRLKKIWADSRYACKQTPRCVWILSGWVLEMVSRVKGAVGFTVLPRRWVVERTFGWFVGYRGLSKDQERNARVSETYGICGDDSSNAPAATTRMNDKGNPICKHALRLLQIALQQPSAVRIELLNVRD